MSAITGIWARQILDLRGNRIAIFDKTPAVWKPEESIGSGVYLLRARAGEQEMTRKVVYLR